MLVLTVLVCLQVLSSDILVLVFGIECTNNTVRLADGPTSLEGRVELCYNGIWGTICNNQWDSRDARVVCRQLGIDFRAAYILKYPGGARPIFLDRVQCTGDEQKLTDCPANNVFRALNCQRLKCAAVVCIEAQNVSNCTTNEIQLNTFGQNKTEGKLQVCHDGIWGNVCSRQLNKAIAVVVCKELGFNATGAFVQNELPGQGPIILTDLVCSGNEQKLVDCSHKKFNDIDYPCAHSDELSISCVIEAEAECNHTDIRLMDGRNPREGRVEICINGKWGTVCDDQWDLPDALVVCKQMGMPVRTALIGTFGAGSGPIMLDELRCKGNESSLLNCPNMGINKHNCAHAEDAGVICIIPESQKVCRNSPVRMRNVPGLNSGEGGYLEVCINGTYSAICISGWSSVDAAVACRQLREVSATQAIPLTLMSTKGAVVVYEGRCSGNEDSLFDCNNGRFKASACQKRSFAGVLCVTRAICTDNDVRLAGSDKASQGRVEICLYGVWGSVCGDGWSDVHSGVVCQQLGYERNGARTLFGFTPIGQGPIYLDDVACSGRESSIVECYYNTPLNHDCTHKEDVGVICLLSQESMATTTEAISILCAYKIAGYASSGVVTLFLISTIMLVCVCCCKRKRGTKKLAANSLETRLHYEHESYTPILPNEYRLQDSLTSNQLQLPQIEHMAHSSLSRVRESYVRLLTEAFIIPLQRITLTEPIGEGEFGVVYMGQLKANNQGSSDKVVAVKTLKGHFEQEEIDKIMEESLKMKHFDHNNILCLIGVCIEARPAPYIVMPYMLNGSLLEFLRKERNNLMLKDSVDIEEYTIIDVEKRLLAMCSQIAQGMNYLANERFIHRDLAARNCMLDEDFVLKISDFGLSEDVYARNYYKQNNASVKLPIKWMAPESLQDGIFSEKSDVWAYGVTCWEVFNGGKNPYPGVSPYTVAEIIENGERLQKPSNRACSNEMYNLMMMCWSEEPDERPSFSEILNFVDSRMGAITGYVEVGYNPFICNGSMNYNHCKTNPLLPSRPTEKMRPIPRPRMKNLTVDVKDETNNIASDEEHTYF